MEMIAKSEYQALIAAYERLQEDYEDLEQEKHLAEWRERCRSLEIQSVEWGKERAGLEEKLCQEGEKNRILSRSVIEREQHMEQLEIRLAEYMSKSEACESVIKEEKEQAEKYLARIRELDQWCGHLQSLYDESRERVCELEQWSGQLQSLCDERLIRIRQLESYVHHPLKAAKKVMRRIAEKER